MKQNRGNRKSLFTKRQIAEALLVLLKEKEYAEVTVSALCESAGCSRPSFYRNFDSIGDAFAFNIRDKIDVYTERKRETKAESTMIDTFDMNLLNLWVKDREFVSLIVRRGLLNDFIMIVCQYLNDILNERAFRSAKSERISVADSKTESNNDRERMIEYRSALQAYYTGAVLYAWAERGLVDSPAQILKVLSDIRTLTFEQMRSPEVPG